MLGFIFALYSASPNNLQPILAAAKPGDTVTLTPGNYRDLVLKDYHFARRPVTIRGSPGVSFRSLSVLNSSGLGLDGMDVLFSPTATSLAYDHAVFISGSSQISFNNSHVTGGPAINGIAPASDGPTDPTGNVQGSPTPYGVYVVSSSEVTLKGDTISTVASGITLYKARDVIIRDNVVTNVRTTPIHGGPVSNITIVGNILSGCHPWGWGKPKGDHADFIHLWTSMAPGKADPSPGIRIENNTIDQGDGVAVLGINLEGKVSGFADVVVSGNKITNDNAQAIRLDNVFGGKIEDNVIKPRTAGARQPGIRTWHGTTRMVFSRNGFAEVSGPGRPQGPSDYSAPKPKDPM